MIVIHIISIKLHSCFSFVLSYEVCLICRNKNICYVHYKIKMKHVRIGVLEWKKYYAKYTKLLLRGRLVHGKMKVMSLRNL